MNSAQLLVPIAAAVVTLPRRPLQRFRSLPFFPGSSSLRRQPMGSGSTTLVAATFVVVWLAAGVEVAGLVTGVVIVGRSQVRAWKQRSTARRLIDELPSLLHDIARRLRSGYPAPLAFAEVLGSSTVSVGGAFAASMLAQGEPLSDAVERWRSDVATLVGPTVLDDLVQVVALSARVGGLHASAVEVLADIASERLALEQETKAQASQAKASATVMTIAPLVFSAQLVLRDPAASRLLLHTPVGWMLIAVGMSFDGAAWLWIRRATSGRVKRSTSSARRVSREGRVTAMLRAVLRWLLLGRTNRSDRLVQVDRRFDDGAGERRSPAVFEQFGGAVEALWSTVVRRLALRREALPVAGPLSRPRLSSPTWSAPWSTERRRRAGLAVVVLPPLLVLRPVLGVLGVITLAVGPALHRRFRRQRTQRERLGAVGQTIELLRLALECGSSPSLAILGVAEVAPAPLRTVLRDAADDLRQGSPFSEVMHRLLVDAPELRAMADVLLASNRLGLPVVETLRGLAIEARASRRRDAEARARRLPVVLLFPVVCLTLPAFVLLTVAPLLLSGLGALHL